MPPKGKAEAKAAAAPKAKAAVKAKPKKEKVEEEVETEKVQAPDKDLHQEVLNKIQEAIDGFNAQQAELTKTIQARGGGKDDFFTKKSELQAQMSEFQAKINALMERKGEINKALGDKKAEAQESKAELSKMKKSIGYTSETQIDERIAEIEWKMRTDTITLKEEKDYIKEIAELKRSRPQLSKVAKLEDSLAHRDFGGSQKEQLGTMNEEINLYRDGKATVKAKLDELFNGRKEKMGDLPDLMDTRTALGEKIREKIKERNELRDEFRVQEREYNEYLKEVRKAKQEKFVAERALQSAEWDKVRRERLAEKLEEQPFVQEMTLIEQTMAFCKSLVQTKEEVKEVEKKEVALDNPEGTEVLTKKEDRDEEFYFVPTKAKKANKSKTKGGKEGSGAKPIKHNAVTFGLFDKIKLDAPITTDDIPAILEKLEEQLESYKEKVKLWEINKEERKRRILEEGVDPEEEAKKEEVKAEAEEEVKEEAEEEKKDDE
mmetsp:Transcript_131991/g.422728  ORF Transcript_131991/g.422728 Transcript_131991/m.422728 type:complete len:490 (+) Transcript_131991:67-1536(+)|eukprot:CAMPEP_0203960802 /NCGR_PEP_ID=MMETSP0359-20131031/91394_1 /ASSEMBLY_ACC=CAM_ASM_000338 /TAXON_ID=268821 /ORGANISM="Scrippsiella Hangoei, Strain SHTV-5" /LENGTH=489 /DNA_ID=CAMNT_0050895295 /DNA_START=71 /DNA_END=1540 /DNA_ORIENTATION=+